MTRRGRRATNTQRPSLALHRTCHDRLRLLCRINPRLRWSGGENEAHKSNHVHVPKSRTLGSSAPGQPLSRALCNRMERSAKRSRRNKYASHQLPCDARQFLPMTEEVKRPCTSLQEANAPTMIVSTSSKVMWPFPSNTDNCDPT